MNRRKELQQEYGAMKRQMGVYQIVNQRNGKRFINSSNSLSAAWQRDRFVLDLGSHMNKSLQAEYSASGGEGFEFEVLEELRLDDSVRHDYKDIADPDGTGSNRLVAMGYRDALRKLEDKWLARLACYEPVGYNRRRRST
ncbi:GIY-YIG nuclease family protein [Paenibacillus xanthanilyticus]|uniref:GIY-YIG nuclease family protein n=1 Tax=Paenibacillus xanthanilyticus TaxID=1783531 RepID=A0ABV8K8T2_9BACL